MTKANKPLCISLVVVLSVYLGSSTKGDRWCKEVVSWRLQNVSTTFNETGVLKKGSGQVDKVQTEISKKGVVNVTTVIDVCCDGFKLYVNNNGKKKCKKCPYLTFGKNCTGKCNCDGFKKCDHKTGECKKCIEKPCKDPDQEIIETTTLKSTTVIPDTKSSTTKLVTHTTSLKIEETTNGKPVNIECEICISNNNCTDRQKCLGMTANRDGEKNKESEDNTVMIAVILSLTICTIILVAGIFARERYHRMKKRKLSDKYLGKNSSKFDEDHHEYVDPDPVYMEINDEDITSNGNRYLQRDSNNPPTFDNEYQMSIHDHPVLPNGRSNSNDINDDCKTKAILRDKKNGIIEDELGYMSPYNPLRFARSESNLVRDQQDRETGRYDVVCAIDRASENEMTIKDGDEKEISTQDARKKNPSDKGESEKRSNDESQNDVGLSESPQYFILEKTQRDERARESQKSEKFDVHELFDIDKTPHDSEPFVDPELEKLLPKQTSV